MPALTPADRLARLTRWLRQAGVDWPDDRVSLRVSPYGGFGVFACQDIAEGAVLATIPKTAVLSVKTSGARDVLREARLGGGLGLVVAVMYERAMGARSPWYVRQYGRHQQAMNRGRLAVLDRSTAVGMSTSSPLEIASMSLYSGLPLSWSCCVAQKPRLAWRRTHGWPKRTSLPMCCPWQRTSRVECHAMR